MPSTTSPRSHGRLIASTHRMCSTGPSGGVAVIAAEAGLETPAWALVAYTENDLLAYRTGEFGQEWIQARLDRALDASPEIPTPRGLHRRDIMATVNDVEAALTPHLRG